MDTLTAFLTSIVALSLGVERAVEIIKGFSKRLRDDPDPRFDRDGRGAARRRLALQAIATMVGAIAALTAGPHYFVASIPEADYSSPLRWIGALLLGLMASGGSAFWNHTLDIVGAIKSAKEQAVDGRKLVAGPAPVLPTGP